jgi:hypothetical protein
MEAIWSQVEGQSTLTYKKQNKIGKDPELPIQLKAEMKKFATVDDAKAEGYLFGALWGGIFQNCSAKALMEEYEDEKTSTTMASVGSSIASESSTAPSATSTSGQKNEGILLSAESLAGDVKRQIHVMVTDDNTLKALEKKTLDGLHKSIMEALGVRNASAMVKFSMERTTEVQAALATCASQVQTLEYACDFTEACRAKQNNDDFNWSPKVLDVVIDSMVDAGVQLRPNTFVKIALERFVKGFVLSGGCDNIIRVIDHQEAYNEFSFNLATLKTSDSEPTLVTDVQRTLLSTSYLDILTEPNKAELAVEFTEVLLKRTADKSDFILCGKMKAIITEEVHPLIMFDNFDEPALVKATAAVRNPLHAFHAGFTKALEYDYRLGCYFYSYLDCRGAFRFVYMCFHVSISIQMDVYIHIVVILHYLFIFEKSWNPQCDSFHSAIT